MKIVKKINSLARAVFLIGVIIYSFYLGWTNRFATGLIIFMLALISIRIEDKYLR